MRLVVEIDLTAGAVAEAPRKEVGRILRYWAGSLPYDDLSVGDEVAVRDSDYGEVGSWRILPAAGSDTSHT